MRGLPTVGRQLNRICLGSQSRRAVFSDSLRLSRVHKLRTCASGSQIEPPDVRKLASLARIKVTDEEVAEWEPKLREIVSWFDQLQAVDVDGVPPCTRSSMADLLAAGKDEPVEFENREALLRGVPDREGDFVKVPKIM